MIQVSDALKDAFLSSRQKNLTLNFSDGTSLTNDSIVIESMKLDQLLCSESQIIFGLCNAAQFSVSIFNGMVSHKDLIARPVISVVDDNGTEHSLQLGVFRVVEDAVSDDRNTRALTCYDALYDVVNENYAEWYTALRLPMTLKAFRDSFFNRIGIQQVAIDLPNDSMTVEKTIETNSLSGSAILKAILEPNASFGFINHEGKFQYTLWKQGVGLFPATDLYPGEDLYPVGVSAAKFGDTEESGVVLGSLVYADYYVSEITGVKIQTSSEDVGMVAGKTGNTYQILGNFLLYGKGDAELRTIGNNFLEYADQLFFRPCKFKARCHPWIELGDFVNVRTRAFGVTMPVLKRTITGITGIFDEYEAKGSEKYTEQANNLNTMVENLKQKTLEIVTNVDEVSTTLTQKIIDEETRATTEEKSILKQTTDSISAEVTRASNAEGELSGRIEVQSERITAEVTRASQAEGDLSSKIQIEANRITSEVSRASQAEGDLSSKIQIEANRITSEVSRASQAEGNLKSTIEQNAASIKLSVTNNEKSSTINITGNGISAQAQTIQFTGNVVFASDLAAGGTTQIDGGRIKTGTVSADRIDVTNLAVSKVITNDGNKNTVLVGDPFEPEAYHSWQFRSPISVATVNGGTSKFDCDLWVTGDASFENDIYLSLSHGSKDDYFVRWNGDYLVYTNEATTSSRRKKNSITNVVNKELDPHRILSIPIRQFRYNPDVEIEDSQLHNTVIGLIAEEVEEHYPVAVQYDKYGRVDNWSERYMIPPMLALIQEQQKRIEVLEEELSKIKEDSNVSK